MTTQVRGKAAESTRLSKGLAKALREARFDRLVDFDDTVDGIAQRIEHLPNVDLAVIELDSDGRVVGVANVLYDRDNPNGYQVSIDQRTMSTQGVQFSRWNADRFNIPGEWNTPVPKSDVLVQPSKVHKRYMVTYPASVLKLMVGFSILRLVDRGKLSLDQTIVYHERNGKSCQYPPSNPDDIKPPPRAEGATDTLSGWFDQMITVSDNFATCVLLQALYKKDALDSSNSYFQRKGMPTLIMRPLTPSVGAGWSTGHFSMGSLDTAKLLLLVSGASGNLWRSPKGHAITEANGLSSQSRNYFQSVLAEQSFNEVLNPVNLCGSSDAFQGIPSTVPQRWVNKNGDVVTYDGDEVIDFGYDTNPCNDKAQVRFMHKTGLVSFAGSDAGIVEALPGQDGRHYIVAIQSSIGYRYGDPDWGSSDPNACYSSPYVCYPRGFGRVGRAVDKLMRQ